MTRAGSPQQDIQLIWARITQPIPSTFSVEDTEYQEKPATFDRASTTGVDLLLKAKAVFSDEDWVRITFRRPI